MIYLLIPFLNEEENLNELIPKLISSSTNHETFFVFVDDGSTDHSVEVIKKNLPAERTVVLGDGKNHGPGYAFNLGFEWILNHSKDGTDKIITLEADNTSDLGILETMLTISDTGFDLVLASIYAQGGGFDKTTFFRKSVSLIANLALRFIFDIKILTLSSFYRIYKLSLIRELKNKYGVIINEPGFISMIEVLIKSIKVNAKIIEVPMMLFSEKRKGKSKMKVLKTMFSYLRFLIRFK